MIQSAFNHIASGVRMVLLSFALLRQHLKLVVYAALTPLLSLVTIPVLYQLIVSMHQRMPVWIITIAFSFFGQLIFNFVYVGMVIYLTNLFQGQMPRLRSSIRASCSYGRFILGWSLFVAVVGTLLSMGADMVKSDSLLVHTGVMAVDFFWWLITFLIIPVVVLGNSSILHALVVTVRSIVGFPLLTLSAGGGLLVVKHFIGKLIAAVAFNTPRLLAGFGLITPVQQDIPYIFMILVPFMSLIAAACTSIITSAAEAVLASGLYLRIIGRSARELEGSGIWQLLLIGVLVLLIFLMIALSTSSLFTLLSFYVPAFKAKLIALFTWMSQSGG